MRINKLTGTFKNKTKIPMDKKITIENYSKDLNAGVFYGWDILSADELDYNYMFQLKNRNDHKLRVYISLSRELQTSDKEHNNDLMYQCYVHNDNGEWSETMWFYGKDLTYKNFWGQIEEIVDKYHQTPLPF